MCYILLLAIYVLHLITCHGRIMPYLAELLLALAMAKRCSELHVLAMGSKHLRFNQSDGLVSLIGQIGFLAKNQLPSICPDPIVIPNLAKNVKGNI